MSITELPVMPRTERLEEPVTIPAEVRGQAGFDLLRLRPVAAIMRWGAFPYVFQASLLAIFVALAVLAWGVYPPDGVPDKLSISHRVCVEAA